MPRKSEVRPGDAPPHHSSLTDQSVQSDSSTEATIVFTNHDTIRYKGVTFTFDSYRRAIRGIGDDAEELLWQDLLFLDDNSSITSIDVCQLKDDLSDHGRFPQGDSNGLSVAGGPKAILDRISVSTSMGSEINFRPGTQHPVLSRTFQIKYQLALHQFLTYLFAIIHTTGGIPMTDRQVLGLRYITNGRHLQQLYVYDGMVMMLPPKGHVHSDDAVPRFLPYRIGQVLIAYLTTVVPFLEMVDLEPSTMLEDEKGYLFDYFGPGAWLTLPMAFSDEFRRRLGVVIDATDFKRICFAIAQKEGMKEFIDAAKDAKIILEKTFDLSTPLLCHICSKRQRLMPPHSSTEQAS